MSLKSFFEVLGAVTPPLVLGFVTKWQELFKATLIMRPGASPQVSNTGIAVSCFLAIVLALLYRKAPARSQATTALCFLLASAFLGFVCYWIRFKNSFPMTRGSQETLNYVWDAASWLFIVAVIQTVLFASMYAVSTLRRS